MTQSPFDQLSKSYLEEFLKPIGTVERQYEIPGEAKHVDVWFIPNQNITEPIDDLGLLGQMAKTPCLIEPYHNPPTREEIRTCILKLLWINEAPEGFPRPQKISRDLYPRSWLTNNLGFD